MEPVTALPVFAFSDLDDTLFQSPRRRDPGAGAIVAALDMEGQPGSFQCMRQQAFFALLQNTSTVIPVTARSTRALSRVLLPFSSWRIASGGAVLLQPDGQEDPEWREISQARVHSVLPLFQAVVNEVDQLLAASGCAERCRILEDLGRPVYLVVKRSEGSTFPTEFRKLPVDPRLQRWITGENLVYAAADVTKRDAVQFLLDHRLPKERLALGFGDSPMDQGFLEICDYAGWPAINPYARWSAP